ncbi:MAG: sulfatase-like hydrolase/transferase, partial [Opitutae bacterium]|nr:sulfatase-like hydrolase/transferase [Opitutae bacterium]
MKRFYSRLARNAGITKLRFDLNRAAAFLGLGLFCFLVPAGMRAEPPNILLILTDDLGWRDLSCYGSAFYETPNIDRLASQGMRFTDAYAAATVCSPTRAALLTGKTPARLHLTDFLSGLEFPHAALTPPDWTRYHLPH